MIGEYREGKLLDSTYELLGFASQMGAETAMLLVGSETQLPAYGGTLYLADATACGEYNPDLHKKLILDAVQKEPPDYIVFLHSSYGWDLAPRRGRRAPGGTSVRGDRHRARRFRGRLLQRQDAPHRQAQRQPGGADDSGRCLPG